ncbi:unnamed protein product [Durusdinium trenchii]|uniref:Uncharacterized protein n=1 Tax=Durusdinium trenchii TaxID=1381693 RepID=A0ABP0RCL3_9DINO
MRALFSQYIECNEDWMSSVLVISTENTEREQTRGTYKWLTKMDLMVKYHQNAALVQELITGKLVSGDWKDHPEFPGREDMRLYRCWVEDVEETEHISSRSARVIREADGQHSGNTGGSPAGGGGGAPSGGNGGKGRNKGKNKNKGGENAPR